MRYLFFDIECADGVRAICEFGYVLTDENFKIIQQKNILINPKHKFNLAGRKNQEDLVLTYSYEEYCQHEEFPEVYDNIRFLMSQKDLLIFGHAVCNDIRYFFKDCERYNLPLFDYEAYDVQKMLPIYDKKNKKFTSLENAFVDLVPETIRQTLNNHRASDDALKTMLVFKAMVADLEFTAEDLIESCPDSKCSAVDYFEALKTKSKLKKIYKEKYKKRKEGQMMWGELYREHLPLLNDPNSIGKLVTITGEMKYHQEELKQLIEFIKVHGYVAYDSINGSDFLVAYDEENKKCISSILRHPYGGKILTYNEFSELN